MGTFIAIFISLITLGQGDFFATSNDLTQSGYQTEQQIVQDDISGNIVQDDISGNIVQDDISGN